MDIIRRFIQPNPILGGVRMRAIADPIQPLPPNPPYIIRDLRQQGNQPAIPEVPPPRRYNLRRIPAREDNFRYGQ